MILAAAAILLRTTVACAQVALVTIDTPPAGQRQAIDGFGAWLSVPQGLQGIVNLAAGSRHCLAIANDGTMVAWGDNSYGQTNVPSGLQGTAAIACGPWHCVALQAGITTQLTLTQLANPSAFSIGVVDIPRRVIYN
ncbi:MAG: hypothetical protein ABSH34_36125 [Verrucomicrobiota bacterium]